MQYDATKVEEAVLALLGVFEFEQGRVWKRYDFGVMDALHERGYISVPRNRNESVQLTEDGLRVAKSLAATYFSHRSP